MVTDAEDEHVCVAGGAGSEAVQARVPVAAFHGIEIAAVRSVEQEVIAHEHEAR